MRASQFPDPPLDVQANLARALGDAVLASSAPQRENAHDQTLLDYPERSILTFVFQGELVPPDPGTEPAAVALASLGNEHALLPRRRNRCAA